MLCEFKKEDWNTLEVSLEDGGYEGQDLSEWGHAAPFHKKKLEGWMSKAQGKSGSASKDQAWSPSRLGCGGGDGLTRFCCPIYFISSCLINPVGESGSREATR